MNILVNENNEIILKDNIIKSKERNNMSKM